VGEVFKLAAEAPGCSLIHAVVPAIPMGLT
jgi:hypothetical protein